jgi:hypothetical protein
MAEIPATSVAGFEGCSMTHTLVLATQRGQRAILGGTPQKRYSSSGNPRGATANIGLSRIAVRPFTCK